MRSSLVLESKKVALDPPGCRDGPQKAGVSLEGAGHQTRNGDKGNLGGRENSQQSQQMTSQDPALCFEDPGVRPSYCPDS